MIEMIFAFIVCPAKQKKYYFFDREIDCSDYSKITKIP